MKYKGGGKLSVTEMEKLNQQKYYFTHQSQLNYYITEADYISSNVFTIDVLVH